MSLQELARKIDISYQQVQKYENGTNRISASRLYAIAKVLNVHINDFFPVYWELDTNPYQCFTKRKFVSLFSLVCWVLSNYKITAS